MKINDIVKIKFDGKEITATCIADVACKDYGDLISETYLCYGDSKLLMLTLTKQIIPITDGENTIGNRTKFSHAVYLVRDGVSIKDLDIK